MHVAALMIFELPDGQGNEFVRQVVDRFRACQVFRNPWNYCLHRPGRLQFRPTLKKSFDIDMEYHVRHLALPHPGGERELGRLISRLHSQRLGIRKPMWELHVIEGLEDQRFALYIKIHHCLADGVSATKILVRGLSISIEDPSQLPFWAESDGGSARAKNTGNKSRVSIASLKSSVAFGREVGKFWLGYGSTCVSMRSWPKTMFNARISRSEFSNTCTVDAQRKRIANIVTNSRRK